MRSTNGGSTLHSLSDISPRRRHRLHRSRGFQEMDVRRDDFPLDRPTSPHPRQQLASRPPECHEIPCAGWNIGQDSRRRISLSVAATRRTGERKRLPFAPGESKPCNGRDLSLTIQPESRTVPTNDAHEGARAERRRTLWVHQFERTPERVVPSDFASSCSRQRRRSYSRSVARSRRGPTKRRSSGRRYLKQLPTIYTYITRRGLSSETLDHATARQSR